MGTEVVTLVRFDLVGNVKPVDFFKILSVAITEGVKFIVSLALLRSEILIGISGDGALVFEPLEVNIAIRDLSPMSIEFGIQICILLLAVVENASLLVNF